MDISRLPEVASFCEEKQFSGKGQLCVALFVTAEARSRGLPIDPKSLLAPSRTQVQGLGKGSVQKILKGHGSSRVLASEVGRTSRGSVGHMELYVAFLNELHMRGAVDLVAIEGFWIDRVRKFFAAKPFSIRLDASRSIRTLVRDVIEQAEERQKSQPGMHYAGAVLQHLVGAKLECALGGKSVQHNSYTTADAPTLRHGDFLLGDVVIHVTTAPSESLIGRRQDNLNSGHRPIIVTLQRGLSVAEGLAANAGIADRIDTFEAEQFVALNLYEIGRFAAEGRKVAVASLVARYNEIIEKCETDPSLKIDMKR